MNSTNINRRAFVGESVTAGAALTLASWVAARAGEAATASPRRIKVGVIGCGSVSNHYLPHLAECPHVELVSTCDLIVERAERAAAKFNIANHYPHIDKMLAGATFDLLVNLTDMQEHERLNRQAISAGKHVWSEKPLANSYEAGRALLDLAREKKTRIWGAPTTVNSPQFAAMAKILAAGKLGRVAAAHAAYGHTGPDWSAFFYEKGGGSLPDLGVYNLTTLTGLLGPAKAVAAITSVITPTRRIQGRGSVPVTAEDNAMVLVDHGNGVISNVQCGFNYFNPHGHEGSQETRHSITIVGTKGSLGLVGSDWEPLGVDLATADHPTFAREATEKQDYVWQQGASLAAQCLATGRETLFTPEHALHVVEIIGAARRSQETGERVAIQSTFRWPVVT